VRGNPRSFNPERIAIALEQVATNKAHVLGSFN
jgi:hypothetical protein